MPDQTFVNALKDSYRDIGFSEGKLEQEVQRKQNLGGDRMDDTDRELLERSAKDGGADGIAELLDTYRYNVRVSRIWGCCLFVMMALFAGVASVCAFMQDLSEIVIAGDFTVMLLGFGVYGLSALLGIGAVLFLIRSANNSKRIHKMLTSYGVPNEEDLYAHIRFAEKRKEAQRMYELKRSDLDSTIGQLSAEVDARKQEAAELLARVGHEFTEKDDIPMR